MVSKQVYPNVLAMGLFTKFYNAKIYAIVPNCWCKSIVNRGVGGNVCVNILG